MAVFWLGRGVLTHEGKDYGFGKELPESLSKKSLASLKKKGLVGDKVPTVNEVSTPLSEAKLKAEITELTGKLDESSIKLEASDRTITELTGKLGEYSKKLEVADKTVAELTTQITKAGKK